jgi:hypothetical protein
MNPTEKRKYARIMVSVPVSCVSVDCDGAALDFNMGLVKDISQGGLALETLCSVKSERLLLSFVDTYNKTYEILGKVMHSCPLRSGQCKVGVMLMGTHEKNMDFVKHLVRFYYYNKKVSSTCQ